jgi:cysteine desulfurase
MQIIYLDHAATTPTDKSVVEEMLPFMAEKYGNPSSFHRSGQEAKNAVEKARRDIARMIGARPGEIVFTSGGTEGSNFAIKGIADKNRGGHIITSAIEHHAVLNTCRFLEGRGHRVTYLPVDSQGIVDPDDLKKAITDRTVLISIMHANNEIGTIEPIEEIGKIARERGICFHTDAVQTFGHLPLDVDDLGVDILSVSAHKFYGPKGTGFVYIRGGTEITSFIHGGEQEHRRRASTHNVPGIVGTGKAAILALNMMDEEITKLTRMRDRLIEGILNSVEDSELNGHPAMRLSNNISISVKHADGESMLLNLDLAGIACSTGSACSSSALEPSHVLIALGRNRERAAESVRFSLGRSTEEKDINTVLDVFPGIVSRIRLSAGYKK